MSDTDKTDNIQNEDESTTRFKRTQSVGKLWLGGDTDPRTGKRKFPTLHITPLELAKAYKLDEPCRITIEGRPELGGILIKYFAPVETNGRASYMKEGELKDAEARPVD